jgi:hypothetical protein
VDGISCRRVLQKVRVAIYSNFDCYHRAENPMAERLSRKMLYDLVWSEPMKNLSARFGISDVAEGGADRPPRREGLPKAAFLGGTSANQQHVSNRAFLSGAHYF